MAKEQAKIVTGLVIEALPNANFKVIIDGSKEEVLAHLAGKMRINRIKVVVGDRVRMEMSPYGSTIGRIVHRL